LNEQLEDKHDELIKTERVRLQEIESLKYQLGYLEREINIMKTFVPKHPIETVSLIPIHEFYAQMPEAKSITDPNKLMMARLGYELKIRQEFHSQLEGLQTKYKEAVKRNEEKRKYILTLKETAKNLINQSQPLQKLFASTIPDKVSTQEVIRNLPKPLYILYNTLSYHKDHIDSSIDILVQGDESKTKSFWNSSRSLTVDEMDIENPTKKQKVDIEVFPSHLTLVIEKISVNFFYLPAFQMVCVSSNVSLENVFLNDDGLVSPNMDYLSEFDFSSFEFGRPFRWAQWLCGLYTFESITNEKPSDLTRVRVSQLIGCLQTVSTAKGSLDEQIKELGK
jgi:hypothetical protein